MNDFRSFGRGGCEWGDWEDNFEFDDPNDRNGASAYFDSWPECSAMQFRVWHIKEDLKIELKGEGFKISETKTKFFPDDIEGKDCSSYCTTIVFKLTEPQGMVEVVIPSEDIFQDECAIKWDNTYIYDLDDKKALLEIKGVDHYKIEEILTDLQRKNYALNDRVLKLKKIVRKMNRYDIEYEIMLARMAGDFRIT